MRSLRARSSEYAVIMREVWGSLNHAGKNWRQVFKGLVLLEYLIKLGSERVVDAARDQVFRVRTLTDFSHYEGGTDKGSGSERHCVAHLGANIFFRALQSTQIQSRPG